MKTQILAGVLTAVLAVPAFAAGSNEGPTNSNTYVAVSSFQPALSRVQVKQEARTAELTHAIPRGQQEWVDPSQYAPSTVARAEIKSETRIAEAHGLIARGQQDFSARQPVSYSDLSRAEVKADARAAEANRSIPRGESNYNY